MTIIMKYIIHNSNLILTLVHSTWIFFIRYLSARLTVISLLIFNFKSIYSRFSTHKLYTLGSVVVNCKINLTI